MVFAQHARSTVTRGSTRAKNCLPSVRDPRNEDALFAGTYIGGAVIGLGLGAGPGPQLIGRASALAGETLVSLKAKLALLPTLLPKRPLGAFGKAVLLCSGRSMAATRPSPSPGGGC